jgi:hypothetical protein
MYVFVFVFRCIGVGTCQSLVVVGRVIFARMRPAI